MPLGAGYKLIVMQLATNTLDVLIMNSSEPTMTETTGLGYYHRRYRQNERYYRRNGSLAPRDRHLTESVYRILKTDAREQCCRQTWVFERQEVNKHVLGMTRLYTDRMDDVTTACHEFEQSEA